MTNESTLDRRRFLTAAGAAVAGAGAASTLAHPASAESVLTIRKQASIPYKPDVLVVGGGPAGIGAALGAAWKGAETLLIEHHGFFGGVAASAGKSMGNCVATGHAAGLAAAMSAKKRCLPRELEVSQLQDALREDGVDLTRGGDEQEDLKNQG